MRTQLATNHTITAANTGDVVLSHVPPSTESYAVAQAMLRRTASTSASFTVLLKYGGDVIDCQCVGPMTSANMNTVTVVAAGSIVADGIKTLELAVFATAAGGNSIVVAEAPFNGSGTSGKSTYLESH